MIVNCALLPFPERGNSYKEQILIFDPALLLLPQGSNRHDDQISKPVHSALQLFLSRSDCEYTPFQSTSRQGDKIILDFYSAPSIAPSKSEQDILLCFSAGFHLYLVFGVETHFRLILLCYSVVTLVLNKDRCTQTHTHIHKYITTCFAILLP